MDKLFETAMRNPGKTMGCVALINIVIYLGAIAAAAVGIRYALTGHI